MKSTSKFRLVARLPFVQTGWLGRFLPASCCIALEDMRVRVPGLVLVLRDKRSFPFVPLGGQSHASIANSWTSAPQPRPSAPPSAASSHTQQQWLTTSQQANNSSKDTSSFGSNHVSSSLHGSN
jgi:hypothetical protein